MSIQKNRFRNKLERERSLEVEKVRRARRFEKQEDRSQETGRAEGEKDRKEEGKIKGRGKF